MLMILFACASSSKSGSSGQDPSSQIVDEGYERVQAKNSNRSNIQVNPNEEKPSNRSLNDMLMQLPGVHVQGQGAYAKVSVSGASASFMSDTSPLFVVNGMTIGTDYSTVSNMVHPNDVTSLSVLKGSDASIYGTRGANGVILIRTK
jgi:TonB-dependent SusC/RagA subfamily outer membrane receptor